MKVWSGYDHMTSQSGPASPLYVHVPRVHETEVVDSFDWLTHDIRQIE